MKYIIALFAIVSFASCKKDYTCTCTDKNNNVVSTGSFKLSKSEVSGQRDKCTGEAAGYSAQYPNLTPITCTLD